MHKINDTQMLSMLLKNKDKILFFGGVAVKASASSVVIDCFEGASNGLF